MILYVICFICAFYTAGKNWGRTLVWCCRHPSAVVTLFLLCYEMSSCLIQSMWPLLFQNNEPKRENNRSFLNRCSMLVFRPILMIPFLLCFLFNSGKRVDLTRFKPFLSYEESMGQQKLPLFLIFGPISKILILDSLLDLCLCICNRISIIAHSFRVIRNQKDYAQRK